MPLILLLLSFTTTEAAQRPNLKFPSYAKRLQDEPIEELPSPFGNKVYLKNKLLNNLNHFFPNPDETLEILGTAQHQLTSGDFNSIIDQPVSAVTTQPREQFFSPIQSLLENAFAQNRQDRHPFPTLIPTEGTIAPIEPSTLSAATPLPKKRSEGPIVSGRVLDSIRDWRKRLYRAFKSRKSKSSNNHIVDNIIQNRGTNADVQTNEVLDFNDINPLIVDKNRQVILSRKDSNWQTALAARNVNTFGRDPSGKVMFNVGSIVDAFFDGLKTYLWFDSISKNNIITNTTLKMTRLFGTEASGYHSKPLNESVPTDASNDYVPLSPVSTNRKSYRTPGGRNVVYIPASHITIQPPPVDQRPFSISVHEVTMTAPPATLPQMITMPYPPGDIPPEYGQGNQIATSFLGSNSNLPVPRAATSPPTESPFSSESDMDGDDETFESECTSDSACTDGQLISEEKCNSLRLRTIIQNNIVSNDAEASKRAVQSAAESETGLFFDAICGTGFFSYIAHTDEFCLASMGGVNCYIFSPVCSDSSTMAFSKLRKAHKKLYLNRN